MSMPQPTEIPFIALRPMLQQIARDYTAARSRSGIALLDAARHLAAARAAADHGEWYSFLETTQTSRHQADRLLAISATAEQSPAFREAIAQNWLGQTAAALLVRLGAQDPDAMAGLLAQEEPPTKRQIEAELKTRTGARFAAGRGDPIAELEAAIADLAAKIAAGRGDPIDDRPSAYALSDRYNELLDQLDLETGSRIDLAIESILDQLDQLDQLDDRPADPLPALDYGQDEDELLADVADYHRQELDAELAAADQERDTEGPPPEAFMELPPALEPAQVARLGELGWSVVSGPAWQLDDWTWQLRAPGGNVIPKTQAGILDIITPKAFPPGPVAAGIGALEAKLDQGMAITAEHRAWAVRLREQLDAARPSMTAEAWVAWSTRMHLVYRDIVGEQPVATAEGWPGWEQLDAALEEAGDALGEDESGRFRIYRDSGDGQEGVNDEYFPQTPAGFQHLVYRVAHLTGRPELRSLAPAAPDSDMPALIARARACGAIAFWSAGMYSLSATPHHPGYHGRVAQELRDAIRAMEAARAQASPEPASDMSDAMALVEQAQALGQWAELVDRIDAALATDEARLVMRSAHVGLRPKESRELINLLAAAADAIREVSHV